MPTSIPVIVLVAERVLCSVAASAPLKYASNTGVPFFVMRTLVIFLNSPARIAVSIARSRVSERARGGLSVGQARSEQERERERKAVECFHRFPFFIEARFP